VADLCRCWRLRVRVGQSLVDTTAGMLIRKNLGRRNHMVMQDVVIFSDANHTSGMAKEQPPTTSRRVAATHAPFFKADILPEQFQSNSANIRGRTRRRAQLTVSCGLSRGRFVLLSNSLCLQWVTASSVVTDIAATLCNWERSVTGHQP
jgi:hypothetical protein